MAGRYYDSDDFDEEYVDEEANAFEVTMAAIFEGVGHSEESARFSALDSAHESILLEDDGEWDLDGGTLVGENPYRFEFTAVRIIEAETVEQAIDIAASELSDEWELAGDPEPLYLDD